MRKPFYWMLLLVPVLWASAYAIGYLGELRRIAEGKSFDCWVPDPRYLRHYAPNCSGRHLSLDGTVVSFRTNAYGLFDRDFSARAPKGVRRILLLGDSALVTYHEGPSLTELLRERFRREKLELINAAVPGSSLVQQRILLRELLAAYEPSDVLLLFDFSSAGLLSAYHHFIGEFADGTGLVERMGRFNFFWPLPEWLVRPVQKWKSARQLATNLRSWQERAYIVLGPERSSWLLPLRRPARGLLDINRDYLHAIERETAAGGSRFFLLKSATGCRPPPSAARMIYKSEVMAVRGGEAERSFIRQCREALEQLTTSDPGRTIPVAGLDAYGARALLGDDLHASPFGTAQLAEQLEAAIRRALRHHGSTP